VSGGVGHVDPSKKGIALLISVLALVLAVSETLGKSAQTLGLSHNIEASNLWSFFQGKTVRQTVLKVAAEQLELELPRAQGEVKAALEKHIKGWRDSLARYESEPETKEGRKELAERAKAAQQERDVAFAAYHYYELASAAVQVGIVLASASIITGTVFLAWIGGVLGAIGIAFTAVGFFAPTAVHLL